MRKPRKKNQEDFCFSVLSRIIIFCISLVSA